MKKLLFLFFVLFLTSCNDASHEIVTPENVTVENLFSNLKLRDETVNQSDVIEIFNNDLKFQGIDATVESFSLHNEKDYFILIGLNADKTIKASRTINYEGDVFRLSMQSSCTCNGCTSGCNPRRENKIGSLRPGTGDCYCTPCISGSGCTKSESIN